VEGVGSFAHRKREDAPAGNEGRRKTVGDKHTLPKYSNDRSGTRGLRDAAPKLLEVRGEVYMDKPWLRKIKDERKGRPVCVVANPSQRSGWFYLVIPFFSWPFFSFSSVLLFFFCSLLTKQLDPEIGKAPPRCLFVRKLARPRICGR